MNLNSRKKNENNFIVNAVVDWTTTLFPLIQMFKIKTFVIACVRTGKYSYYPVRVHPALIKNFNRVNKTSLFLHVPHKLKKISCTTEDLRVVDRQI